MWSFILPAAFCTFCQFLMTWRHSPYVIDNCFRSAFLYCSLHLLCNKSLIFFMYDVSLPSAWCNFHFKAVFLGVSAVSAVINTTVQDRNRYTRCRWYWQWQSRCRLSVSFRQISCCRRWPWCTAIFTCPSHTRLLRLRLQIYWKSRADGWHSISS